MTIPRCDTCSKCCSNHRWRNAEVPVVLLSASTARNEIARRLGVEATLSKPFFAEDLRELVTSLTRDRETVAAG